MSDSEEEEEGEVDLLGNEDGEDDDVAGYSVENAFLEEKEDTCVALRELSLHCGSVQLSFAWLPPQILEKWTSLERGCMLIFQILYLLAG